MTLEDLIIHIKETSYDYQRDLLGERNAIERVHLNYNIQMCDVAAEIVRLFMIRNKSVSTIKQT